MSILKVDKALQQDDDALITTSTKDSDPDNAVVTKDYLKKAIGNNKPNTAMNRAALPYVKGKNNYYVMVFIASNKRTLKTSEVHNPYGSPYMHQRYASDIYYKNVDGSPLIDIIPYNGLFTDVKEISEHITPAAIGSMSKFETTVSRSTQNPDDPTITDNHTTTTYVGYLGTWLRPFANYNSAYRALLKLQEQMSVPLKVELCFCLDDYVELKDAQYQNTAGHNAMFPATWLDSIDTISPGRYSTDIYICNNNSWAVPVIFDATPFDQMKISTFRWYIEGDKVLTIKRYDADIVFQYEHTYFDGHQGVANSGSGVGNIKYSSITPNNVLTLYRSWGSTSSDGFGYGSMYIKGNVVFNGGLAFNIVYYQPYDISKLASETTHPIYSPSLISYVSKNNRAGLLSIGNNSSLSIDTRSDANQVFIFYTYWSPLIGANRNLPMKPEVKYVAPHKASMWSAIDLGENSKITGNGELHCIVGFCDDTDVKTVINLRGYLSLLTLSRSYVYMDKRSKIDIDKVVISDPYYMLTPGKNDTQGTDLSLITMDRGASLNTGLYFLHYPGDYINNAANNDPDAMEYIATQNMWTSLDTSKLYPSYSSNTNPNKLLKDVHRRVLTWRGPIDFNYDAIHYEVPKEGKDKVLTEHWSRSLAFHRSKDCGATGTIQYPQKTYMWNILHNPHLDTNSQYGNADSMWNIYLPNILGGDICMIETYDDWLLGAHPVPDAWHMYASDIWVDV